MAEDKLQQAEQRLRDGDFAAAEQLAKEVGPSYEAHMCGSSEMLTFVTCTKTIVSLYIQQEGDGGSEGSSLACPSSHLRHFISFILKVGGYQYKDVCPKVYQGPYVTCSGRCCRTKAIL